MKDYLKKEIKERIRKNYENIEMTLSLIKNNGADLGKLEWGAILSTYKELIEIKNLLYLYNNRDYKPILNQSEKECRHYIRCLEEVLLNNIAKRN